MKSKVTLINIISSLTLQVVTVISGFIIPKIILTNFGSSVNGLVSSLNQFLSYITLIELRELFLPIYINHLLTMIIKKLVQFW